MDVRPRDTHWPQDLPPVTIIGAGTMGRDIAATANMFGHEVTLVDVDKDTVDQATRHVERRLQELDRKGLLYAEVDAYMAGVSGTTDLDEGTGDAEVVIEAVPEILQLKRETFEDLAKVSDEPLLASNTSSFPIGDIAEDNPAATRIVGTHFFNPVLSMPLVEVIPGPEADDQAVDLAVAFARGLGKEVVRLEKDGPGFVTTRILDAWLTTAAKAAEEQDPSSIDAGFRELGFPMGPFEVMDLSGLDTVASVAEHLSGQVPSKLKELVAEEKLGRKTGEGWYTSQGPDREAEPVDPWPLLAPALAEAAAIVDEGIATAPDVDRAMRLGASFPGGPFVLTHEKGLDEIQTLIEDTGGDAGPLDGIDLPSGNRAITVKTFGDITHVRFTQGHNGNRVDNDLHRILANDVSAAEGPVLVSGEGRYFIHPKSPKASQDHLDPLRQCESLALIHGPLGDGAMSVARACRRRVARIDSAIGLDRPVPAVRAVQLDLVDAVSHPLQLPSTITSVFSQKVAGVVQSEIEELLYA